MSTWEEKWTSWIHLGEPANLVRQHLDLFQDWEAKPGCSHLPHPVPPNPCTGTQTWRDLSAVSTWLPFLPEVQPPPTPTPGILPLV